jgi:hypothetical protein
VTTPEWRPAYASDLEERFRACVRRTLPQAVWHLQASGEVIVVRYEDGFYEVVS